ncbi:MAG: NADH-quinone oxidoreductase subunit L [Phycisphaerales bacterium]
MNPITPLIPAVLGKADETKKVFDLAEVLPAADAAGPAWAGLILLLPILSLCACGVFAAMGVKSKLPAYATVGFLGASFLTVLALFMGHHGEPVVVHLFDWINLSWGDGAGETFAANFSLYVDDLTLLWMLFVTGLGTLIALYASEYMEPDQGVGYCRFFAGVSVFLFAMSCLVMGDNLVLLYLGWEGVGFASYMLIGYYYTKPEAVAAAKKAFIVNRIGDLGLALGIYMTWLTFGTVEYDALFAAVAAGQASDGSAVVGGWQVSVIPFLFMIGAFGKSAQVPLYVWLPDAMEGPTPVSALIHAATMVTAGVYLLCRLFPLMQLHELALPTVAWVGGITALLAATIGMAQYDIKRIMAYSTVSQLGYMFLGVGVMTTYASAYHVFTHAFFKAVLFLTCGAIMHGFAGQLDLRKLSGLRKMPGWRVVSYTMLYGCLCLAGFPYITSGFFSKDKIMAEAFITHGPGYTALGVIALITALLTAYYTFRVWFRVCAGPAHYEMGDDHHGDDHGHDDAHAGDDHGHEPHPPRIAINAVLIIITAFAAIAIFLGPWLKGMVSGSSAGGGVPGATGVVHHGEGFWGDAHKWMPLVASITTLVGISIAWYLHLANRRAADSLRAGLLGNPLVRWIPTAMERKWYVDEIYEATIRKPLWIIGTALAMLDRILIDGVVVDGTAKGVRGLGRMFQPLQNGLLHSYAVSMAGGVALVALLVLYMPDLVVMLRGVFGGQG